MKKKLKHLICIAMTMMLVTSTILIPTEKAHATVPDRDFQTEGVSRAGSSVKTESPVVTLYPLNDSISVAFTKVTDAAGYIVYRKINSGSWKRVQTITQNPFLLYRDNDVKAGYTYTYTVRAYKKINGKNVYSTYDRKGKSGKLTTWVKGFVPKKGVAAINWGKTKGASGYYIYRAVGKNGKYSRIKTITNGNTLSYTNTGLKNGTYYYKVTPYGKINGKKIIGSGSEAKEIKIRNASVFNLRGIENIDCWICDSGSSIHSVYLPDIGMDAEILDNSNPSVAEVMGGGCLLSVTTKRIGSTSITFRYGGKTWKSKINVRKWENPCRTFKLEEKDYSGVFKNLNIYNQYRKKGITTKVQIIPKEGWKLNKIEKLHEGISTAVKNNSNVELSLEGTGSAIVAYFINLTTGAEQKLEMGFGYGEGEYIIVPGVHTETVIK